MLAGITAVASTIASQAAAQGETPRIVGRWTGKTPYDGLLTVVFFPAPSHQIDYEFSGGSKQHASGSYALRGEGELEFTARGRAVAEKWTYSLDDDGHLHLKMKADKDDSPEYTLSRVGR